MIHMTCPLLDKRTPTERRRLERTVEMELETGRGVTSASGMTAVLAVEWCRKHGFPYTLMEGHGRWYVQRGDKHG